MLMLFAKTWFHSWWIKKCFRDHASPGMQKCRTWRFILALLMRALEGTWNSICPFTFSFRKDKFIQIAFQKRLVHSHFVGTWMRMAMLDGRCLMSNTLELVQLLWTAEKLNQNRQSFHHVLPPNCAKHGQNQDSCSSLQLFPTSTVIQPNLPASQVIKRTPPPHCKNQASFTTLLSPFPPNKGSHPFFLQHPGEGKH